MEPIYQLRLSQQCERRGFTLTTTQCERLLHYLDLLLRWRPHLSLTGLRDAERMFEVLIVESLDFVREECYAPGMQVLDLGTGAGVPGLPLALCRPDLHVTLLDRSAKKITFLQRVIATLALHNCQPACSTAEEYALHLLPHAAFDVVVSRGVGTIAHLMRLAAPLLTPGGRLLLRKPLDTPELQDARNLGAAGTWGAIEPLPLPWSTSPPWMLIAVHRLA